MARNIFTKGTAITLAWHFTKPGGSPFDLSGYQLRLFYGVGSRYTEVSDFTLGTNDNVSPAVEDFISWVFAADKQVTAGDYKMKLQIYQNGHLFITMNYNNAFALYQGTPYSSNDEQQEEEAGVVHLYTAAEFYLFNPIIPIVGSDGFWYVNGIMVLDSQRNPVPSYYTVKYDDENAWLLIYKGNPDDAGTPEPEPIETIKDVAEALADWEARYVAAEGLLEHSEAGDDDRWGKYKAAEGTMDSDAGDPDRWGQYKEQEASRNTAYAENEGTLAESAATDNDRWGKYKAAENERNAQYAENEGSLAESAATDNDRWGKYKAAENARDAERATAEGTASSEAGDGSRWGAYKTAENARDAARNTAEGSATSAAGDGSRWGAYKTAENNRDAARLEAEGGSGSSAGDGSRWGAYKTAEAARNTARETVEGSASSEAGDGSRWGAYKTAEAARESAYGTQEGTLAGSVAGDGSRWGQFKTNEAARNAAMAPLVGVFECGTAASTAAKTVTAANYILTSGGTIKIKFANANTAASPTLNINSTGAKAIVYNGEAASASNSWGAGEVVEFYYDPTYNSNAGGFIGRSTVISVSQNTETGHTDITIGSTTTPVPSVEEVTTKSLQLFVNTGKSLQSNGTVADGASSTLAITDFLPIIGNEDIVVRAWCTIGLTAGGTVSPIHFYDKDFNFLWAWTDNYHSNWTYTIAKEDIPNDAAYIRVTGNTGRTPKWDAALIVSGANMSGVIKTLNKSVDYTSIVQQNASLCGLTGKKISFLGDSIMGYGGLTLGPYDSRWYPANPNSDSKVYEIAHTWWGKLIKLCGASLEVNAAVGSSAVSENGAYDVSSYLDRVGIIGSPDVIFVSGGYNEDGTSVGLFQPEKSIDQLNVNQYAPAYDKMIRLLQSTYSGVRIIVVIYSHVITNYADAMIRIAKYYNLEYVDLRPFDNAMTYIPNGGIHPDRRGMDVICGQIVKTLSLKDIESEIDAIKEKENYFQKEYLTINIDGNESVASLSTLKCTPFLAIDKTRGISARVWYNNATVGLALYDKDYNCIGYVSPAHDDVQQSIVARSTTNSLVGSYNLTIEPSDIPVNAVYFRCSGNFLEAQYSHYIYYGVGILDNGIAVYERAKDIKSMYDYSALIQNGTLVDDATTYRRTDYIPCIAGDIITYETAVINNYPLAFYNSEKVLISYDAKVPGVNGHNVQRSVVAPANTAYIRVCAMKSTHALAVPYTFSIIIKGAEDYNKISHNELITEAYNSMKSISDSERLEHLVFDGIDNSYPHVIFYPKKRNVTISEVGFSISDDDTIDGFLGTTGYYGGFYSRAFPLTASVGAVISESVECWRNGMVFEGTLNKIGKVAKILVNKAGWEAMNHTCTARFYGAYAFDSWEDAMAAVSDETITVVNSDTIADNNNTHLYISDRKLNYARVNNEWVVVPACWIRPKLKNTSDTYTGDNPTFPYEYQINDSKKLIEKFFDTKVRVYNPTADAYSVKIAKEAFVNHRYVLHPATLYGKSAAAIALYVNSMSVNKMPIEPIVLRWNDFDNHTNNESDNTDDGTMYAFWKSTFDDMLSAGTKAINIVAHHYRPCWLNSLGGSLPAGWKNDFANDSTPSYDTYPSDWVIPVVDPDSIVEPYLADNILYPKASTQLKDWGNWYMDNDGLIHGSGWHPCPGTRLYSYWKFLLYVKSKGVKFMTLSDSMDRMRNAVISGYKAHEIGDGAAYLGPANYDNVKQRYYLEGADGSVECFVSKAE